MTCATEGLRVFRLQLRNPGLIQPSLLSFYQNGSTGSATIASVCSGKQMRKTFLQAHGPFAGCEAVQVNDFSIVESQILPMFNRLKHLSAGHDDGGGLRKDRRIGSTCSVADQG